MVNVKINGKTYKVGEMKFGDFTHMEEQGFSITDAFAKNQYMLIAMGFTCVATGLDRTGAEELVEQHVLGGGDVKDIVRSFYKAVAESAFFRKVLGVAEPKKKGTKAKTETDEQNVEVDE